MEQKENPEFNRNILSNNIKEWCHQVDPKKLVIFENYESVMDRTDKNEEEEENEEDGEEDEVLMSIKTKMAAIYHTPYGVIKAPDLADASTSFKFWTMYTKIKITHKLQQMIDNIDGIETIEYYTPYRARFSVNPLFIDGSVLSNIEGTIIQFNCLNEEAKHLKLVYNTE